MASSFFGILTGAITLIGFFFSLAETKFRNCFDSQIEIFLWVGGHEHDSVFVVPKEGAKKNINLVFPRFMVENLGWWGVRGCAVSPDAGRRVGFFH